MKRIADDLIWVGTLDPGLRVFDIVMETEFGTTYNSYLLKGSEKTALIETSKLKYFDSYLESLQQNTDIENIDYIVMNHTEPDHSGTVGKLLELNPKIKLVGTAAAMNFMKEIVNRDFNYTLVKNGDSLSLGDKTLNFISVPNLHWPDSMFTYVPEIETLFTCDMFGCHYSSENITNENIEDGEGYRRALKYYFDNIMGPFKKEVLYAIAQIEGLAIKIIATGHGPVLTKEPWEIVEAYKTWATPSPAKGKKSVVVPYVSAYGYTELLAEKIKEGIQSVGDVDVELFDLVKTDANIVLSRISDADGVLFGTPTIVGEALKPIWDLTTSMFARTHGGKWASAFGSFGWSGEGVPNIMARLAQLRLKVYGSGLRCRFKPGKASLREAFEFGHGFGKSVLAGKVVPPKKSSGGNKAWKCLVCGEIVEGDEAPKACPVCGVGPEQFVEVEMKAAGFTSDKKESFIIIGNGAAGTTAAEEIRSRNKNADIEIISKENIPAYNRPMLTKGILSEIDQLNLYLKPENWYKDNNITLTLNTTVEAIEPEQRQIRLNTGETRRYDKLIIASGAESFIPPIPGAGLSGTFAIRTLSDVNNIQRHVKTAKTAVVIGGGVLGLEAAWELKKAGLYVTVVEGGKYLMLRQLDDNAGELLKEAAESVGVIISTGKGVSGILGSVDKGVTGVQLKDGTVFAADMVLLSTGVKQNTELAEKAGLKTERSIVVDDRMETSVSGIFACGDCASYEGMNYAIWMQALEMGKIAGANAVGDDLRYNPVIPSNAFNGFGVSLFAVGDNGHQQDKMYKTFGISDSAKGIYEKLYFLNDRFTGGILIGDVSKAARLLSSYTHESSLDEMLHGGI
ncbi:MAG: FAD-dependent oxidoreductase [Clostridiales Family XIII bacterium]|nr:FAD-dependent oxidoreductase [Clostridiales Family XIII bacterium]